MAERGKPAMHPIGVVTRRTGLRADLIRSWERRHGVVTPARTETGRRLFTDREIDRLVRVRDAVRAGWSVGQIARLSEEELRQLVQQDAGEAFREAAPGAARTNGARLDSCLAAVEAFDAARLHALLDEASVELGRVELLDRFVVPLVEQVGQACGDGRFRMAHEHFLLATIRPFLDGMHAAYPAGGASPSMVVTTPAFQHHELGALLVAATGRIEGWRTVYLGPNLPAAEIVAAARMRGARTVALSITYPGDTTHLTSELQTLGRLLPPEAALLVGGRACAVYEPVLDAVGATRLDDLAQLRSTLDALLARPTFRRVVATTPAPAAEHRLGEPEQGQGKG